MTELCPLYPLFLVWLVVMIRGAARSNGMGAAMLGTVAIAAQRLSALRTAIGKSACRKLPKRPGGQGAASL